MPFQSQRQFPSINLKNLLNCLTTIITIFFFACQPGWAQVIVPFESSWEYLHPTNGVDPSDNDADFGTTWHTPAEYDGPAFSGPAPAMLGYGSIDGHTIATDITRPDLGNRYTAYFRKTLTTAQDYENLKIEILADDGGVFYLNGTAIGYVNYSGEDDYFGLTPDMGEEGEAMFVLIDELEAGEHVFAFSLHNTSATSSDLGFDLQISASETPGALEFLTWTEADGEITITGALSEAAGILSIPDTIDGMPVTAIGPLAFRNDPWSVIKLPDSLVSIGGNSFSGCNNLKSIVIPDSVSTIDAAAFLGCRNLESMVIPDSVTGIGKSAFSYCTSLKSVDLSQQLTIIQERTFENCDSLTEVTIPNGVTIIDDRAFIRCLNLERVTFPTNLNTIGTHAFSDCDTLESLTLPEGLQTIETDAFRECDNLKKVTFPNSLTSIGSHAFFLCVSLESAHLPDGVTTIGTGAFASCSKLTSVTLPDELVIVSSNLFSSCTNLTSVSIPDGVAIIGGSAFVNCTSLTSVALPESLIAIRIRTFQGCTSLKDITLPESLTAIDPLAFQGCSKLRNVTFLGASPGIGFQIEGEGVFTGVAPGALALVRQEHLASFGGEGATWHGLTVRLQLPPIVIREVNWVGDSLKILFSGEPSTASWRILGSSNLNSFEDDLTALSEFTELTPGNYEVVIQVANKNGPYFFRVDR